MNISDTKVFWFVILFSWICLPELLRASQQDEKLADIFSMSLEELLKIKVVTASRQGEEIRYAPAIISVVTAEQIKSYGAKNLLEVLERTTSTYQLGSHLFPQNVISIRGDLASHLNNHVLILLNGRPARESLTGGIDSAVYLSFPLVAIDHIEVIRGPGSVLYGTNAYSGVINIITKSSSTQQTTIEAGSFSSQKLSGYIAEDFEQTSFQMAYKYFSSDGWKMSAFDEIGIPFTRDYGEKNYGIFAKIGNQQWNLQTYFGVSEQNNLGAIPITILGDEIKLYDTSRLFIDAGRNWSLSEKIKLEVNATYNKFEENIDVAGQAFNGLSEDWLLEASFRYNDSEQWQFLYGANLYIQNGEANQNGNSAVPEYNEMWWRAYFETTYTYSPDLLFRVGGQLNKPENVDPNFIGRFALIKQLNKKSGFKFLYGEAFRSAFELENALDAPGVLTGNPQLKPERVATFDLQYFYKHKNYGLDITYFHSTQTDLITRVAVAGSTENTYQNIGELKLQGVELEMSWSVRPDLQISMAFTHQKNERDDGLSNTTLMPEVLLKIGLTWQPTDHFHFNLFNSYFADAGKTTITNATSNAVNPPAEAFHYATLNMKYDIGAKWRVAYYITNLWNEDIFYPEFSRRRINSLPGRADRAGYLSLTYEF